jgi:hypothetical protein
MGRTACTEPQCLYKGTLDLYLDPLPLGIDSVNNINLKIIVFWDVLLVSKIEIFKRYLQQNNTPWIRRILQFIVLCFNVMYS